MDFNFKGSYMIRFSLWLFFVLMLAGVLFEAPEWYYPIAFACSINVTPIPPGEPDAIN